MPSSILASGRARARGRSSVGRRLVRGTLLVACLYAPRFLPREAGLRTRRSPARPLSPWLRSRLPGLGRGPLSPPDRAPSFGLSALTHIRVVPGPIIFKDAGMADPLLLNMATGGANLIGTIAGMALIERAGRRALLLWGAAGS